MEYKYGLLAISGDCAKGGMGDTSDCIIISGTKNNDLIRNYLEAHQQVHILSTLYNRNPGDQNDKEYTDAILKENDLGNKMIDAGVFKHKWHKRTDWILVELDDDNRYPININKRDQKHH